MERRKMTFGILATLNCGPGNDAIGWARDKDTAAMLEFETHEAAEAAAIDLHTNRPSSRIAYAVEALS